MTRGHIDVDVDEEIHERVSDRLAAVASRPVMGHVYDGGRCRFCNVNDLDDGLYGPYPCIEREPFVYTSQSDGFELVAEPQITKDEVLLRWAAGSRWARDCDEAAFHAEYVEPVTRFGLQVRLDDHPGSEAWGSAHCPLPEPRDVPLDLIRYSTQVEGVLVSVLAEVIENGTEVAPCDPEGWFDNDRPVLLGWPDGTYSVRDGNHRCIGGRLRGDETVLAYVIPYDFPPTKERDPHG